MNCWNSWKREVENFRSGISLFVYFWIWFKHVPFRILQKKTIWNRFSTIINAGVKFLFVISAFESYRLGIWLHSNPLVFSHASSVCKCCLIEFVIRCSSVENYLWMIDFVYCLLQTFVYGRENIVENRIENFTTKWNRNCGTIMVSYFATNLP